MKNVLKLTLAIALLTLAAPVWAPYGPGGGSGTSVGYATIAEEGSALTQRSALNFQGAAATAVDNAGAARTDVSFATPLNDLAVAPLDDRIPVGDGFSWLNTALPNCTDTGGNHLNYTAATNSFSCGTTNLAIGADDTVLLSTGAAWAAAPVPNCTDTAGNHLNYTAATNTFSCGTTGGTPAAWTTITAGSGDSTTANGDSSITYQVAQTTAARISWRFTESAAGVSTGTAILLQADTVGASTAIPLLVRQRGNEVFRVAAATTQMQLTGGTVAAPTLTFGSTTTTGLYQAASNVIGVAISGVDSIRMAANVFQPQRGSTDTGSYNFNVQKARGTTTTPTVITSGDDLMTLSGFGYVGATNTYQEAARILFDSTGTISDSATGIAGQIKFSTAKTGAEPAEVLRVNEAGHAIHLGLNPTITAGCGTSPSILGKDEAFTITVGTGGTAATCTVTFSTTFTTNNPVCVSNHQGAILLTRAVSTLTTVVIDAATPFTASGKIDVICRGWE